jgi:histidine phosphotransferase ChpT
LYWQIPGFLACFKGPVLRHSVDKTLIRRIAANRSLLMSSIFTLTPSDLASLLCSKVCHDIISPVGAINNGLELLDEGGADDAAMDLIRTSARNASARLQFARIAFGAAGSAGVQIDTGDAQSVAGEYMRGENRNSPGPAIAPICPRTRSNCC